MVPPPPYESAHGHGLLCGSVDLTHSFSVAFRCIFDANGHEKINIPTAHQRHVATRTCL